jgi:hypothetical protein
MQIEAKWSQPIPLKKDRTGQLIYTLDLSQLPEVAPQT